MAKKTLKLLGVHGLGDHRNSPWREDWKTAILNCFPMQEHVDLEFSFLTYDDIFEQTDISAWQSVAAVGKLVGSGIGSLFGARRRGLFDSLNHKLRWYAGYVVAWVENEAFQRATRKRVLDKIQQVKPDILLTHSLGSLVTFNALTSADVRRRGAVNRHLKKMNYITLGSQIGNPFIIRNLTPGRIVAPNVNRWYHLYNSEDDIFTAPIRLPDAANFQQVDTYFNIEGWADHSAVEYLSHPATASQVWKPLARAAGPEPDRARVVLPKPSVKRKPRNRALLVGINDYPDEAARLEGCVNDVFLMSSVLQECGFDSDEIRVCLNHRATAKGIIERLDWLLDDPLPDDQIVFYYSGHGARLPTYGDGDAVDRMDESLVPYDFDWSPEKCVTDDQIFSLYSQLPYDTKLAMIFDCCHSGGIHRSGGSLKARGIDPPDDIRHRGMKWNAKLKMWETRELREINSDFSSDDQVNTQFCGANRSTYRLGRAMALRCQSEKDYKKQKSSRRGRSRQPVGPYLPVVFEACQEDQYAYEYRHGVTSYGAFTYSIASILRDQKKISFQKLVDAAGNRLAKLGYEQNPQILGPGAILKANVPWRDQ